MVNHTSILLALRPLRLRAFALKTYALKRINAAD